MSDRPPLFTADEILTAALESQYSSRPSSFPHINLRSGVYWHPYLGFRGQAATNIIRLASLVQSSSLRASGQDLLDYVASEFDALPSSENSFAVGEVSFVRTTSTTSGDIPAGTVLNRKANALTQIPIASAQYEMLLAVHFAVGQTVAGPVPVRAKTAGPPSNHVLRTDSVPHGVKVSIELFDETITVSTFTAAGGGLKADDTFVRRYARAFAAGQYGPTAAASRYAVLRASGVRNLLVFDAPGTGVEKLLVGDSSWASCDRWAKVVQQEMYDAGLVGHGCKVVVAPLRNRVVSLRATVALRDRAFIADTTEVAKAVRSACAAYFDREDWNVWKTNGLRSVITRAHPKIFHCSSAVVVALDTGLTLSEVTTPNYTLEQLHFYLAQGAVDITYTGPG